MPVAPAIDNSATATSSNGSLVATTLLLGPNDREARFVFTGTFTGVQGNMQASMDGTTYLPMTVTSDSSGTGQAGSSVVNPSATQQSYFMKCAGWKYIQFTPSQVSSGSVVVVAYAAPSLGGGPATVQNNNASTPQTITSANANAFAVGPNGTTNPTFNVATNTASTATGINIAGNAAASGVAISVLSSGTNENLTIDAKGSGTITLNGTATGAVTITPATTITGAATLSSTLAVTGATTLTGALAANSTVTVASTSASALTVGANGATNPVLKVNANTASVATGILVTGAAAAAGLAVAVISSGTNENLTVDAKGSGTVQIGGTSTGSVKLGGGGGTVVLPGTLTAGGLLTCALQVATSGPLVYSGSGAPTISAAVKGSLYLRSDGSSTSTRAYIATDTAGTWTAITTAA